MNAIATTVCELGLTFTPASATTKQNETRFKTLKQILDNNYTDGEAIYIAYPFKGL